VALPYGLVLLDLPGLSDTPETRVGVTCQFYKKASHVFSVARYDEPLGTSPTIQDWFRRLRRDTLFRGCSHVMTKAEGYEDGPFEEMDPHLRAAMKNVCNSKDVENADIQREIDHLQIRERKSACSLVSNRVISSLPFHRDGPFSSLPLPRRINILPLYYPSNGK